MKECTMAQNSLMMGHLIIHFLTSSVVSEWAREQIVKGECPSKANSAVWSKEVSERRERKVNRQPSGPEFTFRFLVVPTHSATFLGDNTLWRSGPGRTPSVRLNNTHALRPTQIIPSRDMFQPLQSKSLIPMRNFFFSYFLLSLLPESVILSAFVCQNVPNTFFCFYFRLSLSDTLCR